MPFDGLRSSLLAARDARHELLCQALRNRHGTVVFLTLNLPGADKNPPGSAGLFRWARLCLVEALPVMAESFHGIDALGPFALFAGTGVTQSIKSRCMAVEAVHPFGRLLDLDVYDALGRPVDRALLGHPPRSCLLCRRPARECIRLQRHSDGELNEKTHELLAPFID